MFSFLILFMIFMMNESHYKCAKSESLRAYVITFQSIRSFPYFFSSGNVHQPIYVNGTVPMLSSDGHSSRKQLIQNCLSSDINRTDFQFLRVSVGEIAIICSHRKVWNEISKNSEIRMEDWVIIMYDDGIITDNLTTHLQYFHALSKSGIVFLGFCRPRCSSHLTSHISVSCSTSCLYAYAITKRRAQTLYSDLFCDQGSGTCGTICLHENCKLTNRLHDIFQPLHMIGSNQTCPNTESTLTQYYGIICPNNSNMLHAQPIKIASSSRNSEFTPMIHQQVEAMTWSSILSQKRSSYCVSTLFSGRLGNLLFQYASLVGICSKHGSHIDLCIYIPHAIYTIQLNSRPVKQFMDTFALPHSMLIPGLSRNI